MEQVKKIQALIYRINSQDSLEILALRRTPQRGGDWQPVTGNLEEDETFEDALKREVSEEIGINSFKNVNDLEFEFEFNKNSKEVVEKVYAVEIDYNERISLESNPSKEHIDSIWISYDGAFEMFSHVQQKDALNLLYKTIYK